MNRTDAAKAMIDRCVPLDADEALHRDRMIALAGASGDPFSRARYVPGHFTASAFILSPDRGSLLLIHHAKLHRWLQPGGHVEPADADLVAAARREMAEEVGITCATLEVDGAFDLDIHVIPARKNEPQHEHFDVRFLFRVANLDAVAGSDARDCRWVPVGDITEAMTDASVMRALAKVRRK